MEYFAKKTGAANQTPFYQGVWLPQSRFRSRGHGERHVIHPSYFIFFGDLFEPKVENLNDRLPPSLLMGSDIWSETLNFLSGTQGRKKSGRSPCWVESP